MSSLLLLTILLMTKLRFKEILWCSQYCMAKKLINLVLVTLLCPLYRWRDWWVQAWEIKRLLQGRACGWEVVWSLFLISNAEFFPWFGSQRQKQNLTFWITHLEAGSDLSWSTTLHCFLKDGPGFTHSGIKLECMLKCIFLGPAPVFESNALTTRSGICILNKHPRKGLRHTEAWEPYHRHPCLMPGTSWSKKGQGSFWKSNVSNFLIHHHFTFMKFIFMPLIRGLNLAA